MTGLKEHGGQLENLGGHAKTLYTLAMIHDIGNRMLAASLRLTGWSPMPVARALIPRAERWRLPR